MATVVGAALDELKTAKAGLDPIIEGETDYSALDLQAETRQSINVDQVVVGRRHGLMVTAIAALIALTEDGYPELPTQAVAVTVLDDLDQQIETLMSARARFTEAEAEAVSGEVAITKASDGN